MRVSERRTKVSKTVVCKILGLSVNEPPSEVPFHNTPTASYIDEKIQLNISFQSNRLR